MENKIGVYCSVSKYEEDALDIVTQNEIIQKYIVEEIHTDNYKIYIDDDRLSDCHQNINFRKMLLDIKNGSIKTVILTSLDRITYNLTQLIDFMSICEKNSCDIITVIDNLHFQSNIGRLKLQWMNEIMMWCSKGKQEESNRGLIKKIEKGQCPIGKLPLGYKKSNDYVVIDETTSNVVIDIFDYACEGMLIDDIRIEIKVKRRLDLSYNTIRSILQNKIYIGEFYYKGKLYKNIAPPLIEKKKFEKAEMILRLRTRETVDGYYFKNKIRCKCGTICSCSSTLKSDKKYFYYKCSACHKRINQDKIITEVLISLLTNYSLGDVKINLYDKLKLLAEINERIILEEKTVSQDTESGLPDLISYKNKLVKEIKLLSKEDDNTFLFWRNMSESDKVIFIKEKVASITADLNMNLITDIKLK